MTTANALEMRLLFTIYDGRFTILGNSRAGGAGDAMQMHR